LNRLRWVSDGQKKYCFVSETKNLVVNGCFFYVNEIGVRRGPGEC
jgi:hypothetical protein